MNDNNTDLRLKIEIIPVDDVKSHKIGFSFYEIGFDGLLPDGTHIDDQYQPNLCAATNLADQYKVRHHKAFEQADCNGYMVIPVLEFLKGKPWDNMALNFIESLRPSYIRVTLGEVTCDARTWRVTVFLEQDERTIRNIEQEVQVGLYGLRNGSDANLYMQGIDIPKHQSTCIINPKALEKLKIKD